MNERGQKNGHCIYLQNILANTPSAPRYAPKTAKKMNMCKNLLHTLKNP